MALRLLRPPSAVPARALVANVALPLAFELLPNLQMDPSEPIEIIGWAFRGLRNLPVTWDVS